MTDDPTLPPVPSGGPDPRTDRGPSNRLLAIAVVVVVVIGVALGAAIVISRQSTDEAYTVSEQDQGPPGTSSPRATPSSAR